MSHATLVVLGSGGVVPTPERLTPAFYLEFWNGLGILLDAGEGAQRALGQAGFSPHDIDYVLVTHAHGDHVNGLAGLLQSMAVSRRRRPLRIIAPRSVVDFAMETLEATGTRLGFQVDYSVAEGRGSARLWSSGGDEIWVDWFPVCHTMDSVGFRVRIILRGRVDLERLRGLGLEPGPWLGRLARDGRVEVGGRVIEAGDLLPPPATHSLVYTGDTAPCRSVLEASRGARILLHDSTFASDMEEEAVERGHSTSRHAAFIAKEAGVEALILFHVSPRYRGVDARRLLLEARSIHPGTLLAWDLMRVRIPLPRTS